MAFNLLAMASNIIKTSQHLNSKLYLGSADKQSAHKMWLLVAVSSTCGLMDEPTGSTGKSYLFCASLGPSGVTEPFLPACGLQPSKQLDLAYRLFLFPQAVCCWGSILEEKELATLTGRGCGWRGWALCPGLVLLLSFVAGPCPLLVLLLSLFWPRP